MNNLSDIVSVQIEIQSPATDQTGFGTMLIVGCPPNKVTDTPPPDVGKYTSIDAVQDVGWLPSQNGQPADPVYDAARVVFSQIPFISQSRNFKQTGLMCRVSILNQLQIP